MAKMQQDSLLGPAPLADTSVAGNASALAGGDIFAEPKPSRGRNARKLPRLSIAELNDKGVEAIQQDYPDLPERLDAFREEAPNRKTAFEKVLDWVDLPRNLVGNAIGALAGVDTAKLDTGALGLPKVQMSDVLNHLGMEEGPLRSVIGFVGDVAIDPLTYLTLGAGVGVKVAEHLPKLAKPLVGILKDIAQGVKLAPEIEAVIKPALGGEKVWAAVQQAVQLGKGERLMAKNGGVLTQLLARNATRPETAEAVSKLLTTPGMAIKGRPLFGIPFTQVAGPTLPYGKNARAYRAVEAVQTPEVAEKLRRFGQMNRELPVAEAEVRAGRAAQEAQGPMEATFTKGGKLKPEGVPVNPGAEQFTKSAEETAGKLAFEKQMLQRGEGAPDILKLAQANEYGQEGVGRLGRFVARVFGNSPLKAKGLAALSKSGMGAFLASNRAMVEYAPEVDRLAAKFAAKGIGGGDVGKVKALFNNVLDIGSEANIDTGLFTRPNMAIEHNLWKTERLGEIAADPEFQSLSQKVNQKAADWVKSMAARGTPIRETEGYYPRSLSKEASKEVQAQAKAAGGEAAKVSAQNMPGVGFTIPRTRGIELFRDDPATGKRVHAMLLDSSDKGKLDKMITDGWRTTKIAIKNGEEAPIPPELTGAAHDKWVAEAKKAGMKVQDETFAVSEEAYNQSIREGKLGTLLGTGTDWQGKPIGNKALGPFFEPDPAKRMANRAAEQERADAITSMKEIAFKNAVPVTPENLERLRSARMEIIPALKPDEPMAQMFGADLFGKTPLAVPEPVANVIKNFREALSPAKLPDILRWTDRTLGWFKRWALYHPGYIIRNVFQNTIGQFMAGGDLGKQWKYAFSSPEVNDVFRAIADNDLTKLGNRTIRLRGTNVPLRDIAADFIGYNGQMAGRSTAEYMHEILRGEGRLKGIIRKGMKSSRGVAELVRQGNAAVEARMRMGSWLSFIDSGLTPRQAMMRTLTAMPDMNDLTRLERTYAVRLWPWWRWFRCVPITHRIFTRNGWKTKDELVVGEEVLTYNLEKDKAEWQPVRAINSYRHQGMLMKLEGQTFKWLFTPEHRWPVWGRHVTEYFTKETPFRKMVKGYELRHGHRIPKTAPCAFNGADESITPREAALIGWIFTDGHMRSRHKGKADYPDAVIYQSKVKHHAGIRALLGEDARGEGIDNGERNGNTDPSRIRMLTPCLTFRMSASLARRLYGLCPTKAALPSFVTRLTEPAAKAMWQAMMDAEGSTHPRAGIKFTQNSGDVLEAFQLLTILLNRTADTPGRADKESRGTASYAYISTLRAFVKAGKFLGTEMYDGEVWCPTTDNGTWFMEHEGRVIITGNSNGSLQLLNYLPNKPAYMASVSKLQNFIEGASTIWRGDGEGGNVPEELRPTWMREQNAAQVSGDKNKGQVFALSSWLPFQELQSVGAGMIEPGAMSKYWLSQARPGVKFVAETAFRRDLFKGSEVQPFTYAEALGQVPAALAGQSGTPLDNLLSIRPVKEYGVRVWDQGTPAQKGVRAVIGGALQEVDTAKGVRDLDVRSTQQLVRLRSEYLRAREKNDNAGMMAAARQAMLTQAVRQRYNLPVPKAMAAGLAKLGVTQKAAI